MATWQLQTAKAKLSELLRAVREHGPQVISVRGKEEYLVIRQSEAQAQTAPRPKPKSLRELLEPIRGLGDELDEQIRGVREEQAAYKQDDEV